MSIGATPGTGYTKPLPGSTRYKPALTGVELIAQERKRQIEVEGWDSFHDRSEHTDGELVTAAACYIEQLAMGMPMTSKTNAPKSWPWEEHYWKPSNDAVRNLTKAGALIAAEIDRLQWKSQQKVLPACKGTNCGCTDGFSHSPECRAELDALTDESQNGRSEPQRENEHEKH